MGILIVETSFAEVETRAAAAAVAVAVGMAGYLHCKTSQNVVQAVDRAMCALIRCSCLLPQALQRLQSPASACAPDASQN